MGVRGLCPGSIGRASYAGISNVRFCRSFRQRVCLVVRPLCGLWRPRAQPEWRGGRACTFAAGEELSPSALHVKEESPLRQLHGLCTTAARGTRFYGSVLRCLGSDAWLGSESPMMQLTRHAGKPRA